MLGEQGLDAVETQFLPAPLHNRPERIAPAIEAWLKNRAADAGLPDRIVIGYADCGTGGHLDALLDRLRQPGELLDHITVERLPGDHCYSFLAGTDRFAALHEHELGTFFLTDYLARHFDTLIWATYRFEDHPELIEMMFGNYTRLVYLSQTADARVRAELTDLARSAARRLGLRFETLHTGLSPFSEVLVDQLGGAPETESPR